MSRRRTRPQPPKRLRAELIEIVDRRGRVRAVLGDVGRGLGAYAPGVALLDAAGRERVVLFLAERGPQLSFAQEGNGVVDLGAHDPGPEAAWAGAYLVLSDANGRPILGWRVHQDGTPEVWAGEPPMTTG